jgi:anti-sigma factor RsiW
MKVCTKKRKRIVELALDALESGPAQELQKHLESCAGCREYLAELSRLNNRLHVAGEGDSSEASDAFHERVMRALRDETAPSGYAAVVAWLQEARLVWRVAVAGLGGLAVAIAAWLVLAGHPGAPSTASAPAPTPVSHELGAELPPSVANYRIAANRSLEQLDDLLTQQANRHESTRLIYTASAFGTGPRFSD